jgi:hypothetical protein
VGFACVRVGFVCGFVCVPLRCSTFPLLCFGFACPLAVIPLYDELRQMDGVLKKPRAMHRDPPSEARQGGCLGVFGVFAVLAVPKRARVGACASLL